jgi:hypothetical protein
MGSGYASPQVPAYVGDGLALVEHLLGLPELADDPVLLLFEKPSATEKPAAKGLWRVRFMVLLLGQSGR